MSFIDIVFDGPPAPDGPRFVEVENRIGHSKSVGTWVRREDGYWALRLTPLDVQTAAYIPEEEQ